MLQTSYNRSRIPPQDRRFTWGFIALFSAGLVVFSHYFFGGYLFMRPCEHCVYIRYAMLVIAVGSLFVCVYPPSNALKFMGFVFGFYGVIMGIEYALTLDSIYNAVENANPFVGVAGCRKIPIFPFNLPLHIWLPSWFMPSGECGLDIPYIPQDLFDNLSSTQQFFIGTPQNAFSDGLYSGGWRLIPMWDFVNMATFCLIAFIAVGLLLVWLLFCFMKKEGASSADWTLAIILTVGLLVILSHI